MVSKKGKINSTFISPLRYPGGKVCIYKFMCELLRENNLIGINYAEPYAGGCGLALKLLVNEYVNTIYLNDLDRALYAFWNILKTEPLKLCDWIEDVNISTENWHYYKNIHRNKEKVELLDLAKATFFLNRTNISGVLHGGIIGGQNQTGKYKIDARFNKQDLINRILLISKFANRIKVSNKDGINFINFINRLKKETFIYLDPPYVVKGANLYMNHFQKKDHLKLSKKVAKLNKIWLTSYDDNDDIHNLYQNYNRLTYSLSQSTSNRVGREVLIFSNFLQNENSIKLLANVEMHPKTIMG